MALQKSSNVALPLRMLTTLVVLSVLTCAYSLENVLADENEDEGCCRVATYDGTCRPWGELGTLDCTGGTPLRTNSVECRASFHLCLAQSLEDDRFRPCEGKEEGDRCEFTLHEANQDHCSILESTGLCVVPVRNTCCYLARHHGLCREGDSGLSCSGLIPNRLPDEIVACEQSRTTQEECDQIPAAVSREQACEGKSAGDLCAFSAPGFTEIAPCSSLPGCPVATPQASPSPTAMETVTPAPTATEAPTPEPTPTPTENLQLDLRDPWTPAAGDISTEPTTESTPTETPPPVPSEFLLSDSPLDFMVSDEPAAATDSAETSTDVATPPEASSPELILSEPALEITLAEEPLPTPFPAEPATAGPPEWGSSNLDVRENDAISPLPFAKEAISEPLPEPIEQSNTE